MAQGRGTSGLHFSAAVIFEISSVIFAYYIIITNQLPATLAALIPKHHHSILVRYPSVTCGWDYLLPTSRQTHSLITTTRKYLLQVPQSVGNEPIIVANWKFPA